MINGATKQTLLRCLHLILSIPMLGYAYGEPSDVQPYAAAVRYVFVPLILLSGFWMYSGVTSASLEMRYGSGHICRPDLAPRS